VVTITTRVAIIIGSAASLYIPKYMDAEGCVPGCVHMGADKCIVLHTVS
jgi:hypothetical protein